MTWGTICNFCNISPSTLIQTYLCRCIQHKVVLQCHHKGLRSSHLKPELNNSAVSCTLKQISYSSPLFIQQPVQNNTEATSRACFVKVFRWTDVGLQAAVDGLHHVDQLAIRAGYIHIALLKLAGLFLGNWNYETTEMQIFSFTSLFLITWGICLLI